MMIVPGVADVVNHHDDLLTSPAVVLTMRIADSSRALRI
jgi:hypothetical protein